MVKIWYCPSINFFYHFLGLFNRRMIHHQKNHMLLRQIIDDIFINNWEVVKKTCKVFNPSFHDTSWIFKSEPFLGLRDAPVENESFQTCANKCYKTFKSLQSLVFWIPLEMSNHHWFSIWHKLYWSDNFTSIWGCSINLKFYLMHWDIFGATYF